MILCWTWTHFYYALALWLALQSWTWQDALQRHATEMSVALMAAAQAHGAATTQQELAVASRQEAAAQQAAAKTLQEEAAVLLEQSTSNAAMAAAEQEQAKTVHTEIVFDQEESAAATATAALEQVSAQEELTAAVVNTAAVTRWESAAQAEEIGTGLCEFVPGLDVLCTVVGGATTLAWHGLATVNTEQAAAELVVASAIQVDEDKHVTAAAMWESKAVEDTAMVVTLQNEQATNTEMAQQEHVAAEEKQSRADLLLEQAQTEQEMATQQEVMSAEEQSEAVSLAARASQKAVISCWDAIMASICGFMSLSFFVVQVVSRILPHIVSGMSTTPISQTFCRDLGYNIQHCLIFCLFVVTFANSLHVLHKLSLRARGGILVKFAAVGSLIQTVVLHVLPMCLASLNLRHVLLHAMRFLLSLFELYLLEILCVYSVTGTAFASCELLQRCGCYWALCWLLALLPLGAHVVFLEIPLQLQQTKEYVESRKGEKTPATETDALLPTITKPTASKGRTGNQVMRLTKCEDWWTLFGRDLASMKLPLELFFISCLTGVLIHCVGVVWTLWPTCKAIFWRG